jgi:hypothetical protein
VARAGLVDIKIAMADQIRTTVAAVTDVDVQVEPMRIFNPTPPTVDIYWGARSRDEGSAAFDDVSGAYLFTVRARVPTSDHDAGRALLDEFADDTSDLCLAQALLDDPTLNGYVTSIDVREFSGETVYVEGDSELLGFQFTVMAIPADS